MEVKYIHHAGDDISVVNAARVSFAKESGWDIVPFTFESEDGDLLSTGHLKRLTDRDEKLIRYLHKHKHKSPFNHAFLTVRVSAPMFVARQLVKHKFMPWNEVSRRYVDFEPEVYGPNEWRSRSDDKKQGSSEDDTMEVGPDYVEFVSDALAYYQSLLDSGVCPEQARMVLPLSTYTEWYWSGTLGAFLDMLKLRLAPDTQAETRQVAQDVATIVKDYFPNCYRIVIEDD